VLGSLYFISQFNKLIWLIVFVAKSD